MRIARVAWAFFSIGFLAGSFESAAGLGRVEAARSVLGRDTASGAIVRSTAAPLMMFASFNAGLPEELLARPLMPQARMPDGMAEALADLAETRADPAQPVLFAPLAPEDRAMLAPTSPNVHRPRFGARRKMSEVDRAAMSRRPAPLSPEVVEPFWVPPAARGPDGDQPRTGLAEFIMPFERGRVTSLFNQGRFHPAIDLAGALGSPVHATTRRQRVTFAGWRNGYGNAVITRDDLGRTHLYGHLQRIFVRVGTLLDQGQKFAALGSTGHSTGPHVHYELRTRSGARVDPVTYLFGRRVGRGYAWNGARSVTRFASRADGQPRPR